MSPKRMSASAFALLLAWGPLYGQTVQKLSLNEAVSKGLENSKSIKLSKAKIEESVSKYKQTKDAALPQAKVSGMYNHAYIPNNQLIFPGAASGLVLPKNADVFLGTATVNQILFAGYKYKYAESSSEILQKMAELDVEHQKEEVIYHITQAYCNLFKLKQSLKVVNQTYQEIDERITETGRLLSQGLATQNDVLKWKLQKSNVDLTANQLNSNLHVVNYQMALMLGLPEDVQIEVDTVLALVNEAGNYNELVKMAFSSRSEFKNIDYQAQNAELNIKSAKSSLYPSLVASGAAYYLNPSSKIIPSANTYLTPLTIGATLSYDIGSLYTFKNKVNTAKVQKMQTEIVKTQLEDQVKLEIRKDYESYLEAHEKIKIVATSVEQASENYRTVLSKYDNNIASTRDKIEAETMLFEAKINKELAKADLAMAYYSLLKSMGTIHELANTTKL